MKASFENDYKIIPDLLYYSSERFSEVAFVWNNWAPNKTKTSFSSFMCEVLQLANALHSKYPKSSRIALTGKLDFSWLVWFFSILLSGNIVIPIDSSIPGLQVQEMIEKCGICLFVLGEDVCNEFPLPKSTVNSTDYQKFYSNTKLSYMALRMLVQKDDIAMIVFTSGTSGKNKAVMLSHNNILQDTLYSAKLMIDVQICPGDTIIPLLPPFHMLQVTTGILAPIFYGMTLCITNAKNYRQALQIYRPCILVVVPTILESIKKAILSNIQSKWYFLFRKINTRRASLLPSIKLLRPYLYRKIHSFFGKRLHCIVCGGAFLEESIIQQFAEWGIIVLRGYGITECSPVVCCNTKNSTKRNSVGKPDPQYCQIMIKSGEILARGPIVFKGYYQDSQKNACVFSDGWFHTGDTGFIDEEGYLYLTGRLKDIIVLKNGHNVAPVEIESIIEGFPNVTKALVSLNSRGDGIEADVKFSQKLSTKDLNELLCEVNKLLPKWKQLDRINVTQIDFSVTATGKLIREKYVTSEGKRK